MPFEVRTSTFDESIYEKIKEAEQEMISTAKRYSSEEISKSMNDIIG